ncbi:hypothetical protein, partial [Pontibacillus yanchengensis]|uniref:hypothetical protein n=1 Tax=Pontibacillus yanchengensis TaxID=462910 RepID=UPI00055AB5D7
MKRLYLSILCSLALFIVFAQVSYAQSGTNQSFKGIGYNSMSLDEISQLEDIKVKENRNKIELQFVMDGEKYNIKADKWERNQKSSDIHSFVQTNVKSNKLKTYNITVANGYISGVYVDRSVSLKAKNGNKEKGFGFILSNNDTNLSEIITEAKDIPEIKKE